MPRGDGEADGERVADREHGVADLKLVAVAQHRRVSPVASILSTATSASVSRPITVALYSFGGSPQFHT